MPEPTPEAWAQIRFAYEHTDRALAHICAEHDITVPMLRYRMKVWEWVRRKPLIPREGPPAVAPSYPLLEGEGRLFEPKREPAGWGDAVSLEDHPTPPAFAHAAAGDPPRPGEGEENIVPRLRSAVARVLRAIEATITRLAGPSHPREMEQAARTLSALTRTLRELNALLVRHHADPADEEPRDMDEFRNDLARRIRGIIEARRAAAGEAKADET